MVLSVKNKTIKMALLTAFLAVGCGIKENQKASRDGGSGGPSVHLKASESALKKQLEVIRDMGRDCFDDINKCKAVPSSIVVNFPALNLKPVGTKKVLYTDNWSYEYPSLNADIEKSAKLAYWIHNDSLKLKDSNQNVIQVNLEVSEQKCSQSYDISASKVAKVLFRNQALEAIVLEKNSPRTGNTIVRADYKNASRNMCLTVMFFPVEPGYFSVENSSEIGATIKKILLSVKIK